MSRSPAAAPLGAVLVLAFPLCLTLLAPAPARAQQPVNPIHPTFAPLDAAGRKVTSTAEVALDATCGACHDSPWIAGHTIHGGPAARATCAQCHLDGGRLEVRPELLDGEGRLVRAALRIGAPRAANCGACHGLVSDGAAPILLPPALEQAAREPARSFTLTEGEGAIVAPQRMADSFLNLVGKEGLSSPWDVHAAKLVDCVACHFAANNPGREVTGDRSGAGGKAGGLRYLTVDPRRPSTAEFLLRPDHRLTQQSCRSCHDAQKAHEFLPYRERHLTVLACQTCHLAEPRGPALEMVDATVLTLAGTPVRRYRNVTRRPGEALNAASVAPFRPLLVERVERDGVERLAPVNTVSRFRWVSGPDRAEVPAQTVAQAWLQGGRYPAEILAAFDADRDGVLDERELRLDGKAKTDLVAARLRAAGVVEPTIEGTLEVFPLAHGVPSRERALRDCAACHSGDSRISERYVVASFLPGGTPPRPKEGGRFEPSGRLSTGPDGALWLERDRESAPGRLHVLGHSRQGASNTLGFWLFVATSLGVLAHGLLRWTLRHKRSSGAGHAAHAPGKKEYLFGRYERIWHWTMALSGILLIVSGLEIHGSGAHWLLPLPQAVSVHNAFAVVLIVNAFLAFFYHLTTKAIRNFIPAPQGLLGRVLEHMEYQSRGIFFGGSHPSNAPGQKLNPLQQLTYLGLLNLLFPLQIGTGLLLWAAGTWPEVAAAVGGLSLLAPLHNAGSWLFLSFFVLHVYLVSTGRTTTEHLASMITGYGELATGEVAAEPPAGTSGTRS